MYKIIGANQVEYGPVTADQLRQWIAEGRADANTRVRLEGTEEWKPLREVPEFAASFAATAAPPTFTIPDGSGPEFARQQVNAPSICLMIVAGIAFVFVSFGLLANLMGFGMASMGNLDFGADNEQFSRAFAMMNGAVGLILGFVQIAACLFVFYGAFKMRKLESYPICITASILAMIPCCLWMCCVLGVPAGIWSLVVLNQRGVKEHFH